MMAAFVLLMWTQHSNSSNYWEPKSTLKKSLNMYASPTSVSPVVDKIPKGAKLKQLNYEMSKKSWIYVTYNGTNGFVYKGSVRKFQVDLNPLQELIFNSVSVARDADNNIFVYFAGSCHIISQQNISELPAGKRITAVEYLNNRGGFNPRNSNSKARCNSH